MTPLAHRVLLATVWSVLWCVAYPQLGPPVKAWALARLGPAAPFFFTHYGPEMLLFLWGWWGIPLLQVIILGRLHPALHGLLVMLCVAGFAVAVYRAPWQTAQEAARRCPVESGLFVHRKVQAASLHGLRDIRDWRRFGFDFVEYTDALGRHFRLTLDDGRAQRLPIAAPASRHELAALPLETLAPRLTLRRLVIRERATGEILGESRLLLIHRGWADRLLANGFHFTPPSCFGGIPAERGGPRAVGPSGLVAAVITPSGLPMP